MAWWENDFLKVEKGKLLIGEKEASKIAERQGTPLFVYSRKQVLSNFHTLLGLLRKVSPLESRICYALKANAHPRLLKILKKEGAWIDAVSPGEVDMAREMGFPSRKILFTGTSVGSQDLQRIFLQDGVTVTIDALEQLDLMRGVKERNFKNKVIRVAIRWNPGIGRGFSPKTTTAGQKSPEGIPIKFGIEDKKVLQTFEKATEYGFIPVGLHQHLGSGWVSRDFETVKDAVKRMVRKASEIQQNGYPLEFLDFGGGFGPRYFKEQKVFPLERYIRFITQQVARSGLQIKAIALEPGKYLVGNAGVLLLRVEYIKESYGNFFACVDGGTFTSIPRPVLYPQARHPIVNCTHLYSRKMTKVTVAGNLCETGDVFGQEIPMPVPRQGDILAVLVAGAYCRSMASHFNLRDIPPEIVV